MSETVCPSCGAQVTVKNSPKIGSRITCNSCNTELEVVWLDPLELDWPLDEFEEDLDDDFDGYYDDED